MSEAFWKNPEIKDFKVSPKHLHLSVTHGGNRAVIQLEEKLGGDQGMAYTNLTGSMKYMNALSLIKEYGEKYYANDSGLVQGLQQAYQLGDGYMVTVGGQWSAEGTLVHVFVGEQVPDAEMVRKYYGPNVIDSVYQKLRFDRLVIQRPDGTYAVAPMNITQLYHRLG